MKTKFYANENFDLQVVEYLRIHGFDVLTSLEAGNANQRIPDDAVLQFATSKNRALLTFNRKDFFKLHKKDDNHSGIVACTYDNQYEGLADRIKQATIKNEPLSKKVIRIYRPNSTT